MSLGLSRSYEMRHGLHSATVMLIGLRWCCASSLVRMTPPPAARRRGGGWVQQAGGRQKALPHTTLASQRDCVISE